MSKILEINQKLQRNDRKLIEQVSGVPYATVRSILSGHRHSNTRQGKKVIRTAEIIIQNREKLIRNNSEHSN